MTRPGARVARRKDRHSRVGAPHRVRKEETAAWFRQRFDGIIGESLPLRASLRSSTDTASTCSQVNASVTCLPFLSRIPSHPPPRISSPSRFSPTPTHTHAMSTPTLRLRELLSSRRHPLGGAATASSDGLLVRPM